MGYIYKTNHNYFKKIDSEQKAYLLGLLYADGCVKAPKGNRQGGFAINLQGNDGYILENFSELTNREVKYHHPKSIKEKGWKERANISIVSNEIYNDLINLGCLVNKSRVGMNFPTLSNEMLSHFIRGFLDGDGSIIYKEVSYKYKRKSTYKLSYIPNKINYKLKIAFCSTDKVFLEKIASVLSVKYYLAARKRKQIIYVLWIENRKDVFKTLEYLYKDATIFLKRKHDKIEKYNMSIKSQAESKLSEGLETT